MMPLAELICDLRSAANSFDGRWLHVGPEDSRDMRALLNRAADTLLQEPVAWIEFAENGNCRWFTTHREAAERLKSEKKLVPLYALHAAKGNGDG